MIKALRKELRARFIDEVACVVEQETILSLLDYVDTLESALTRVKEYPENCQGYRSTHMWNMAAIAREALDNGNDED